MSEILEFISVFDNPSNRSLFTECACYWFSEILHLRFDNSRIVYDPHRVHFATKIDGTVYDIQGVIKEDSDYLDWEEYSSYANDYSLIDKYCIRLERK